MGKTPCSEGIIGINATSESTNATIKKVWSITIDTFAHFWEYNSMKGIPSRSFGSNLDWFCKNDTDLLNLSNKKPPFPNRASWTVFSPSNAASVKVISVLRMQHSETGKWIRLKKAGKHIGKIGVPLSDLWECSLGYTISRTSSEFGAS